MSAPFSDLAGFLAAVEEAPVPDMAAVERAAARNAQLTKPPGSLGRLEELVEWMAAWQGQEIPRIEAPQVIVFAGNHGVAARGVSAFPPEVTVQMVANFEAGGAAINCLSALAGAKMDVHPISLDQPTADFTQAPAMTEAELTEALRIGWEAVDPDADLLVTGEMGIGNTTPAAAIAAALYGGDAAQWCGRGTGLDDAGVQRKTDVVAAGLVRHADALEKPLEVMRCLGGRELAAMAGAIASARAKRIPVILDGFICTASAAVLEAAVPGALDHAVAGHLSEENAHGALLEKLGKSPLLSLGLRLGEGSGAALAIQLVRGALACHSGMATFAEAGVSAG